MHRNTRKNLQKYLEQDYTQNPNPNPNHVEKYTQESEKYLEQDSTQNINPNPNPNHAQKNTQEPTKLFVIGFIYSHIYNMNINKCNYVFQILKIILKTMKIHSI